MGEMGLLFALLLAAEPPAAKGPTPPRPPEVTAPRAPEAAPPVGAGSAASARPTAGDGKGAPVAGKSAPTDGKPAAAGGPAAPVAPEAPTPPTRAKARAKREIAGPGAMDKPSADRAERILGTTPPSLTTSALRNEARFGSPAGESAPAGERAKLEALAADIARAREALRQDTAKLETMLKGGGRVGGDGRMPVGDGVETAAPLAPKDVSKEQVDLVSKAMKGMKPEQAAAILARLDRLLAAEILRRMRPADAGAVMGALKPEVAADLATVIATKKPLGETAGRESR